MLRSVYTRTASAMAALLAGALLLAGCASGPMTPSTDEPPPGDGAFPVTLHNAYGDVTIKERPKRIAALRLRRCCAGVGDGCGGGAGARIVHVGRWSGR